MGDLEGRVVAITGAARGIGRAFVRGFLAEGSKVVAMDRSWEPSGFSGDTDDSYLKELQSRDDVLIAAADITDDGQVQKAYDDTIAKFGTVDALINNAGVRQRDLFPPTGRTTLLQTDESHWEKMFAVHVFGSLRVTRKFIQPMLEKKRGSIMSIVSSGALHSSFGGAFKAFRPNSMEMPYQSAKAALLCWMFYLGDEIKGENIAVNLMIPGHTRTTGFDEQNAARQVAGMGGARQGPAPMRPDHMVPLATFLASKDANSGVTGKAFDAMTWNIEHGAGNAEFWADNEGVAASEVLAAKA